MYIINVQRYHNMLINVVISQQRKCFIQIICIQDGAPLHIVVQSYNSCCPITSLMEEVSRDFTVTLMHRSSDLIPCNFWVWGCLC